MRYFIVLVVLMFVQTACNKVAVIVAPNVVIKPVEPELNEVSGIADSKRNKGFIWAHEDVGYPLLHLVGHDGVVKGKVYIGGTLILDWEDIAVVGSDLYIGDIGDNGLRRESYMFFTLPEPSAATDTTKGVKWIRFQYPDGAHNAEAFLVDEASRDILIITKDSVTQLFKLSMPYSHTDMNHARKIGQLPFANIVSAAISPNGREIILKDYRKLYRYYRQPGETLEQVLQKSPDRLPYVMEPQGEAVTFAADGSGYFTLSEKGFGSRVNLFYYPWKK